MSYPSWCYGGGVTLVKRQRFGDEVTLKRFVYIDDRRVVLPPESHNPGHHVMQLDVAKHIPQMEGVAICSLIGELHDVTAA